MKKRFLRKISLLLVLVLALALSACGGADSGAAWDDYPADGGNATADAAEPGEEGGAEDWGYGEPQSEEAGESYLEISENDATLTNLEDTLSFSLKVDTAAYSNVARYLEGGSLPPANAVRVEELVNYFSYEEEMRFEGDAPFALYAEVGPSPFDANKYMAFVRVATPELDKSQLPSTNFTFLIDTSGSMNSYDKLPLLQDSLALLVEELDGDDIVSIVTYAGSSEVVLDSVSGSEKDRILEAIYSLSAGGSTAGEGGIVTAYALAEKNRMNGGNNRVIIASDGDFNVGISSVEDLAELISEKRDSGVYLSVLGFGTGNLRDDVMETLAANGNGNYSYIDNLRTAQKVLVEEMGANLFTVADDVKAQVQFNADNVRSYRLIGYENRRMSNQEFWDDGKDAGEIGVGTDVVMLFELELYDTPYTQGLRTTQPGTAGDSRLFEVRVRYKDPGESEGKQVNLPVSTGIVSDQGSSDFGFACSVAAFGHLLRESEYTGTATLEDVMRLARDNLGQDPQGYRLDYLLLLRQYESIIA